MSVTERMIVEAYKRARGPAPAWVRPPRPGCWVEADAFAPGEILTAYELNRALRLATEAKRWTPKEDG